MSKSSNRLPRSIAVLKNLKALACAALFASLSIVCGKYLAIPMGQILRFSFENLPIILSGVLFGPILGAITGILADLVGCLLVGYAINPIVTLGAATIGIVSGLVATAMKKSPLGARLSLSVAFAHISGSVIIKTFGLAKWYDLPLYELMLWRLLNYLVVGILEYIIIYAILRSRAVNSQIDLMLED
ncbi:MAG: folate family ECF transporter S component [Clostridia bacterium]|nr:folate family ECF transporter S component [Clostridia bacterium]